MLTGDSKTVDLAQAHDNRLATKSTTDFESARRVLRDPQARQAGFMADTVMERFALMRPPILFLSGEAHRRQRTATGRFFAPKAVTTRYRDLMVRHSDRLIARFAHTGKGTLNAMAFELAVAVAAEIVGLTESDPAGLARRLEVLTSLTIPGSSILARLGFLAISQFKVLRFFLRDVRPAIRARERRRRDDVISHLLDEGYTAREILTECLIYAAAGMVTTREFITLAAWHMIERPDLRARFLGAEADARISILEEILRLEPVVGRLYRRIGATDGRRDGLIKIDIRAANMDPAAAGSCPYNLDPDRRVAKMSSGALMAFGDGEHRCPGGQVAMLESVIFLDRLLRTPGLKLISQPDLHWNLVLESYEVRHAEIACDVSPS
jgi:cytochrome P450